MDGCNTDYKPPFGKFGGNLTDECEVYKMETNVLEEVRSVDPDFFAGSPHPVDQETGQKAIDAYCNTAGIRLKSPEELKNQGFVQFSPDSGNYVHGLENWVLRMEVKWDADAGKKCRPSTAFNIDKNECKSKYGRVLRECTGKFMNSMQTKLSANCIYLMEPMGAC